MKYMDFKDFPSIISQYYPIGISYSTPAYFDYEGIKELRKICWEKFENPEMYEKKWKKSFIEMLKKEFLEVKRVSSETLLSNPCYTGYILINEVKDKFYYSQELYFHVSLLCPYFSIYGLDTVVIQSNELSYPSFEPIITISPQGIYEKYFTDKKKN